MPPGLGMGPDQGYDTGRDARVQHPGHRERLSAEELQMLCRHSAVSRSQRPVPGLQQHALQEQLAVAVHVGLVQPHGQVAQGEVAVRAVRQLLRHHALQAELPPVHVGEPAGNGI